MNVLFCSINKETQTLSISESAIHELTYVPNAFQNGGNNISVQCNNSTSSTMEESGAVMPEEKSSPARRKRLKFKKKTYVSFLECISKLSSINLFPLLHLLDCWTCNLCNIWYWFPFTWMKQTAVNGFWVTLPYF